MNLNRRKFFQTMLGIAVAPVAEKAVLGKEQPELILIDFQPDFCSGGAFPVLSSEDLRRIFSQMRSSEIRQSRAMAYVPRYAFMDNPKEVR